MINIICNYFYRPLVEKGKVKDLYFLGVSGLLFYTFRQFVNDFKYSRQRAPQSRAAAARLKHARHRFLTEADITLTRLAPLWKNSASVNVCGEETFFL